MQQQKILFYKRMLFCITVLTGVRCPATSSIIHHAPCHFFHDFA